MCATQAEVHRSLSVAGPLSPPRPVKWSFLDKTVSPPCAPDSLNKASFHSPGNSLTAQDRLQTSCGEPVPHAAAAAAAAAVAHCPAHHLRFRPDPVLMPSALQQTETKAVAYAEPGLAGPGCAWPDPADGLLQPAFCQTALQLSMADNSGGNNSIAAHPGGAAMPPAQLQETQVATLQQKAVSQLQQSSSAAQLQASDSTAQQQLSGGSAQLPGSGGTAQLQTLGSAAQLQDSGSKAQPQSSGETAQLQQKLHPVEVQISAVAQKKPLQRHAEESSAKPMLSQQADEGDPTYRPAADKGDPTCRPAAEEHAPRYTAGTQTTCICCYDVPAEMLHH